MFELLIGIDSVHRGMRERGEKIHRERRSRLRSVLAAARSGAGSAARGAVTARPRHGATHSR